MKLLFLLVCLAWLQSLFGSDACNCDQGKLTALHKQLQLQNERLQLQNEKIEALKKTAMPRHEVEENQIAFSVASHDYFGPVTVDTNIPFPVVNTNVGDAWNPVINAFQATKAGFYLFTTSFYGTTDGNTYASIVHTTTSSSQRVATLFSSESLRAGDANAAIIQVATGDYVSVQLHADSGVIGSSSNSIFSTFSGHLLFP